MTTLLMGAVAYDPKVVTIWEGFRSWFAARGLDFDFVLYSNYERQVLAQLRGDIHVAWNSPLAWLETARAAELRGKRAEAILMRDTDCDLTSVVVVSAISPFKKLEDLRGKRVAVGAADSPQATLIPLGHLCDAGIGPSDIEVVRHDILVGKHGDHIGGEREAARDVVEGRADAACLIDGNHLAFARDGTLPSGSTRILAQTGTYDHCNFTVMGDAPRDLVGTFRELLLSMRYDDPDVRPLMDLEGLKAWRPGRTSGYAALAKAIDRFGTISAFLASVPR
jgi:ABC-type phosphate/phosphonate transport system substrate-binding protein